MDAHGGALALPALSSSSSCKRQRGGEEERLNYILLFSALSVSPSCDDVPGETAECVPALYTGSSHSNIMDDAPNCVSLPSSCMFVKISVQYLPFVV